MKKKKLSRLGLEIIEHDKPELFDVMVAIQNGGKDVDKNKRRLPCVHLQ